MTRASMRRTDRDEVFLELTKSVCPVCKAVVEAELNIRDNRVIMRKRCHQHGEFEALIYSDAELYMSQLRYNKPGTLPLEFQTEVKGLDLVAAAQDARARGLLGYAVVIASRP